VNLAAEPLRCVPALPLLSPLLLTPLSIIISLLCHRLSCCPLVMLLLFLFLVLVKNERAMPRLL